MKHHLTGYVAVYKGHLSIGCYLGETYTSKSGAINESHAGNYNVDPRIAIVSLADLMSGEFADGNIPVGYESE